MQIGKEVVIYVECFSLLYHNQARLFDLLFILLD